uniref:TBC1 domain member 1 n=1 Tax=Sphaerodactylus townsendi TaxID=933632 RepID=A0ACB8E7U6_9SAUR
MELWQKAILQQILLLRMEKENQKLQGKYFTGSEMSFGDQWLLHFHFGDCKNWTNQQFCSGNLFLCLLRILFPQLFASENNLLNKRLKLDYEEITPCLKEVTLVWEKMLSVPGRSKTKFDVEKIHSAIGKGVPRHHRGEIWKFLAEQYQLKHQFANKQQPKDMPYKELLKQLTSQQHAILIDLGRTFPTHPYFSAQLGAGQLSLYNILKAYSLLDSEVGYCQGLSFVAGVLLLHMAEEEAFKMLKFLMFDIGLRKQYRPDMTILQIQMYQLSRLLHDYHRDLYNHFEAYEIGPSLYAAPWFLTMFASQFPLGFVARVFDMLFLQGSEVIFKVALSLLGSHKPLILQHESLEAIVDFIKCTLPNLGLVQMEKTINQVFEMDISKQLQAYEVEYHVLQDELIDSSLDDNQRMDKLEKANSSLHMLFLQGSEVIFKVALSLLGSHKPLILQHESLEAIVDFIKCTLPNLGLVQMEKTINQVFEMDISKQLQAYEVEYHVLQDELIDSSLDDNQRMDKLEKANSSFT